jgi:hypothetical protein
MPIRVQIIVKGLKIKKKRQAAQVVIAKLSGFMATRRKILRENRRERTKRSIQRLKGSLQLVKGYSKCDQRTMVKIKRPRVKVMKADSISARFISIAG